MWGYGFITYFAMMADTFFEVYVPNMLLHFCTSMGPNFFLSSGGTLYLAPVAHEAIALEGRNSEIRTMFGRLPRRNFSGHYCILGGRFFEKWVFLGQLYILYAGHCNSTYSTHWPSVSVLFQYLLKGKVKFTQHGNVKTRD